jgi:integrase/recombinase XerD
MRKRKQKQPVSNAPQGMEALLEPFYEWMRIRNFSEATVETRQKHLRYFLNWATARGITQASEVTKPIVERYQRYLYHYRKANGAPLAFRTQVNQIVALRSWFKWLARNNHILYNPTADIEMPRLEHRLPKFVLTESEVEQVINQADVTKKLGIRDRAIMETFYSTGMRRKELINLRPFDIDAQRGTVVIWQAKGHKDRIIPIGERALAWIDRYLVEVRPGLLVGERANDVLFLTHTGHPFTPTQMTDLMGDYVTKAEIGKQGSCHIFRHTAATLMLENGADIRFIQEMLGHASLETTQIYARVSIQKLKEVHAKTHPARKNRPKTR